MDEKQIPQVRVGIMNEPEIEFVLNGDYRVGSTVISGGQTARCVDGQVEWGGNRYGELLFEPVDAENASFTLKAVTIGVSFHWKRKEDQTFTIAIDEDLLDAADILPGEQVHVLNLMSLLVLLVLFSMRKDTHYF